MVKIIRSCLIVGFVAIIYFQLYWHYWFVWLLGGYIVNTLFPIAILLSILLLIKANESIWRPERGPGRLTDQSRMSIPLISLAWYLILATCSVFLHEEGFVQIRQFLVYVWSPPLVFMGLLGIYRRELKRSVDMLLFVFFLCAVVFSIYVATIYLNPDLTLLTEMPSIGAKGGTIFGDADLDTISADTGATYGFGDEWLKRFTIPGINSTHYGPMLMPLILVGFYFMRHAGRKATKLLYIISTLFLSFSLVMTASRAAIFGLAAGMLYLAWQRWIRVTGAILISIILFVASGSFSLVPFLRVVVLIAYTPLAYVLPSEMGEMLGATGNFADLAVEDPHIGSIPESVSFISQYPILGAGRTRFAEFGIFETPYGNEHNNYLSVAGSFGLPALGFYIAFILFLFRLLHHNVNRVPDNTKERDLGIALGAGMIAFMVCLNGAPTEFQFIWVWFGLAGAWVAQCNRKRAVPKGTGRIVPQFVEGRLVGGSHA